MILPAKKFLVLRNPGLALLMAMLGLFTAHGTLASPIRITPSKTYTEGRLELYFRYLRDFKELCGHYPVTTGALAFYPLSNNPEQKEFQACVKYGEVVRRLQSYLRDEKLVTGPIPKELVDGWDVPMKYSSDGRTFRLEASHGYSVTDQTKSKKNGLHWDNSNPPPDDPPLPIIVHPRDGGSNLY